MTLIFASQGILTSGDEKMDDRCSVHSILAIVNIQQLFLSCDSRNGIFFVLKIESEFLNYKYQCVLNK
jgi:hypothetical protein